jgi:hypothetical protein
MSDIAALYRRLLDGLTAGGKLTPSLVGGVRGGTTPPVHSSTIWTIRAVSWGAATLW